MIKELNENNFNENTKNGLKLVEFYAAWCGYCQKQRPILNELSENNIWIGGGRILLPGGTTGRYSVIRAVSGITRVGSPYRIAVWSRCRVIRYFDTDRERWQHEV